MASVDFNLAGLVIILDHVDATALVNAGPNIGAAVGSVLGPALAAASVAAPVATAISAAVVGYQLSAEDHGCQPVGECRN